VARRQESRVGACVRHSTCGRRTLARARQPSPCRAACLPALQAPSSKHSASPHKPTLLRYLSTVDAVGLQATAHTYSVIHTHSVIHTCSHVSVLHCQPPHSSIMEDTTRLDRFACHQLSLSGPHECIQLTIQRAFAGARTYLGKFRGRYLPLGQSMQVKWSVAPLVSEYFPMSHV
jgi:hypothetical protein